MKTVLIIDDSSDYREIIKEILAEQGLNIIEAKCPEDAYHILLKDEVDAIVCDLNMPFTMGADFDLYPYSLQVGVQTIRELGWVYPGKPIVGVTAAPSSILREIKNELGDVPLLAKPFAPRELFSAIESAAQINPDLMSH